jgi:hypothetical protein
MKSRIAVAFLLAGMLAVLAGAQKKPAAEKPAPEKPAAEKPAPEKAVAEKKDPLSFVKIAGDVPDNVQSQSLNGYLAIYIDEKDWSEGLKDSDLGPFLKVKEAKPGRSAACFFSSGKDAATCVYFDGDTPFGVAAVKAGASGQIQASDITAAYKSVTKEMLKKGNAELDFSPSDINTDDGTPLPAFQVTSVVRPQDTPAR